jgi:hypothetical protein
LYKWPQSAGDCATGHIYVIPYGIVNEHALIALSTDLSRAPFVIAFKRSKRARNFPLIEGHNIIDGRQSSGSLGQRCRWNKAAK